ncbi:MAG: hypothetical protein JNJ56_10855 [Ignavibacteria bacterium]|nr:hypothetical protein [Ignavibacteria bacterium]
MKKFILFLFVSTTVLNSVNSSSASVTSEIYNFLRNPSLFNLADNKIQEVTSGFSFQNIYYGIPDQLTCFTINTYFHTDNIHWQSGKLNVKTAAVYNVFSSFANNFSVFAMNDAEKIFRKNNNYMRSSVPAISNKNDFSNLNVEI